MIPNATADGIDDENYPLTTDELLARYGQVELELAEGSERLGEAVGRLDDEVYQCPSDVHCAVFAGVGGDAVGRRNYSDRDPTPLGALHGPDQVSF